MQVLFLNPYSRGSHRAFFEQWALHSNHSFQLLNLSGRNWKWRMRHGAWTLAQMFRSRAENERFDVVVSTDMLDLSLWKACAPRQIRDLPHVLYFHENQLVYPDEHKKEADLHFALTNIFSAALADEVWFNSRYHLETFVAAARRLDRAMPSAELAGAIAQLQSRAQVCSPGVSVPALDAPCSARLRIAWVGRWEWDKGNDRFVELVRRASKLDVEFVVLGARVPEAQKNSLEGEFGNSLQVVGFLKSREQYLEQLSSCDLIVSTARHEFFGLAVLEAALCGCVPLVPKGLAYREVFAECEEALFYEGPSEALRWIEEAVLRYQGGDLPRPGGLDRFRWQARADDLDTRLLAVGG